MAAVNFDTLKYVQQLTDAGVDRSVAEIHAMTMEQAMGFYVNNLVTKDYLDARFDVSDAKLERRLSEQDTKFEKRFNALENRFDSRVVPIELAVRSMQITQRFQSGLLLLLVAGLLVPPVLSLVSSLN
ncbi:hypothetical protein [Aequoribacter sp.]|uniref:hypothetical protein n=1 Tax=Aequoribacter sp. TaxID=2847771 RepID=UPI003C3C1F03